MAPRTALIDANMLLGVGIDIESIHRIEGLLQRFEAPALRLIFTPAELQQSQSQEVPAHYLALCFSAKEAMGKALGTGLAEIDWFEIEADIQQDRIVLGLQGKALRRAKELGATCWQASWSTLNEHVVVTVLILGAAHAFDC